MSELKPCPTPRTDALRGEYARLKPYNWSSKFDKELSEKVSELERELIATQATLKEAGEALLGASCHCFKCDMTNYLPNPAQNTKFMCRRCKALSNPLVIAAMKDK